MQLISNNFKSFGKALKWLLDEANMSQREFSQESGIDEATISKYISGEFNPPRSRRIRKFNKVIGGQIKQSGDEWIAKIDKTVKSGAKSVGRVEDELASCTVEKPLLDEISRELQFAKELIERTLSKIEKIDSGE